MDQFVNGFSMGALLLGVLVAARSVFRVEEGHLGLLTAFKAVKRSADGSLRTFSPGLHMKLPWERVVQVNMMEQHLALPEDGGREAIAEDGTVLRLDASMRYTPALGGLHEYVFGMRHTSDHLTHLFTALMRNELANVRAPDAQRLGGSYALIRRDRKPLDLRIEAACKAQLDDRYGVKFRAVDVTDIHPPDELADALNAVIAAHSHAEERYFRAEGDSQQRVLAAREGVDIARARAKAAEDEILVLGNALSALASKKTLADYVRRRRAEVLSESRALFLKEEA